MKCVCVFQINVVSKKHNSLLWNVKWTIKYNENAQVSKYLKATLTSSTWANELFHHLYLL